MDTVTHPQGNSQGRAESLAVLQAQDEARWNSPGAVAYRRVVTAAEAMKTACNEFVQHSDECDCAYCQRRHGFNFTPEELVYEIGHIKHTIANFISLAGSEGGIDPAEDFWLEKNGGAEVPHVVEVP